jgi:hypothetical protein
MLAPGTLVQIQFPIALPAAFGRLIGFYADEPRRAVVLLPSGESLVVMESDVAALSDDGPRFA